MKSHQTLDFSNDVRRSSKTLTDNDPNNQFYYKIDLNSSEKVSSEFGSSRKDR